MPAEDHGMHSTRLTQFFNKNEAPFTTRYNLGGLPLSWGDPKRAAGNIHQDGVCVSASQPNCLRGLAVSHHFQTFSKLQNSGIARPIAPYCSKVRLSTYPVAIPVPFNLSSSLRKDDSRSMRRLTTIPLHYPISGYMATSSKWKQVYIHHQH